MNPLSLNIFPKLYLSIEPTTIAAIASTANSVIQGAKSFFGGGSGLSGANRDIALNQAEAIDSQDKAGQFLTGQSVLQSRVVGEVEKLVDRVRGSLLIIPEGSKSSERAVNAIGEFRNFVDNVAEKVGVNVGKVFRPPREFNEAEKKAIAEQANTTANLIKNLSSNVSIPESGTVVEKLPPVSGTPSFLQSTGPSPVIIVGAGAILFFILKRGK